MPDNVTAPAGGISFATDDIGGVHYPYAKLAWGADNSAVAVADVAGARLPVVIGGTLPAFAATPTVNIGTVPSLAVTGPATDVQLRATPLAVSFSGQSVAITGTLPAFAATPTVNIGTAPTLTVGGTVTANAGTGTFAISAASLPLPSGAATAAAQTTGNTSLASIDGKLPALASGRVPVDVPTLGSTTREYSTAAALRLAVAATSSAAALPTLGTTRELYVHAVGTRVYLRTGDSTISAAVAAAHHVVEAGEKFHWRVPSGHTHIAVIGDGGTGQAIVNAVA